MGWGQPPSEIRAAEEAAREARERAESRPMSPFERKLIGVLEDIRDRLGEPLLPVGDGLPSAHVSVVHPDGSVQDFGTGTLCSTEDPLSPLLDSAPAVLARSVAAGGLAIAGAFPTLRDDFTAAGFEKFAEVAIEAALHEAARDRAEEAGELTAGGVHRIDVDAAVAPATSRRIAERAWRGPGNYLLASTAASTEVYATTVEWLADVIAVHPVLPPDPSPVEQQQGDEADDGEPVPPAGPSSAAPE